MAELLLEEVSRYSRHLILPEVGLEGQRKLKNSKVLCVGSGGLGSPIAMYLAAAGVGTLGIIDDDIVTETNLQRQIIHSTRNLLRPKVTSAKERIEDINPYIEVIAINRRLDASNALPIFKDYDVIVDGTDNFGIRYLINDACVLLGKPDVYGGVLRVEGQASVFHYQGGACLRCLYSEEPLPGTVPTCTEGGILNVLPGIIGCIQANETIKILLGKGETLSNRLLMFDSWKMKFREITLQKDPLCPVCGTHPVITELKDGSGFCCASGNSPDESAESIEVTEWRHLIETEADKIQIIDVREEYETALGTLPNVENIKVKNIPSGQIVCRKDELSPAKFNVFICTSGVRSQQTVKTLLAAGFEGHIASLRGGINAWRQSYI
ncbi:MAG: molybdopterin-synthase adenylyltransferase MoeB [Planctomycetaceae bacterium]|jgi:adenylyltransferase/sulfurtransferase|nr:molybdopterin-synthase adenylyltransferase MoeB [Planctomycetaceae bacterium]